LIGAHNGVTQIDAIASVNLTAGDAVYIDGISGNTPTVALARSNSSSTMPSFGLAASTVTATNSVKIIVSGQFIGLDAANFGETGITFALGDTLFISSAEAGKLTNVKPAGEANLIQNIGKVERATPTTNMTILVAGAGRTAATPALNNGNIFIGDSNNNSTTTPFAVSIDTTPQLGGGLDVLGHSISSSTSFVNIEDEAAVGPTGLQLVVGAQGQLTTNTGVGTWATVVNNSDITGSGIKIQTSQSGSGGTPFEVFDLAGDSQFRVFNDGKVTVNNAYDLPLSDGTPGQVLQTNGSGVTTFGSVSISPLTADLDVGAFDIISSANGDIDITPNGTGSINLTNAVLKTFNEVVYAIGTTGGTVTPDIADGSIQTITLNADLTFNGITGISAGDSFTLVVTQDVTGSRLLTSSMKFAGGTKTLSTAGGSIDIISVFYDGVNYYASLTVGYA